MEEQLEHRKQRRSQTILKGAMVLLALVAVFALAQLVQFEIRMNRLRRVNEEARNLLIEEPEGTPEPTPEPAEVQPMDTSSPEPAVDVQTVLDQKQERYAGQPQILRRFEVLTQSNPDVVGWLTSARFYQIDFPVVQRDNEFYLDHDSSGAKNVSGAAFMDEYCSTWPRDDNLIVYAHNLASGEMFGSLFRMEEREF
ncbi:MAG: class B sortase, partial [Spirochaetales bacterium]|nr:class B sortase [Spirochaetales bacterium]